MEKKKVNILNILLIVLMAICGFIMIIFLSTYFRWIDESKNLVHYIGFKQDNEIVYEYKNNIISTGSIKDFYGESINLELNDNEYIDLYCNKDRECIYISNDNIYVKPYVILYVLSIIMIICLFFLYKSNYKMVRNVITSVIFIIIGTMCLFLEIYRIVDYYVIVNNTKYLVNGEVVGYVKKDDNNIYEVINYELDDKKGLYYNNKVSVKDNKIGDKVTLYYDKNDINKMYSKCNPINFINLIYGIILVVIGVCFIKILKDKKEV